jgi:hypothetical protein
MAKSESEDSSPASGKLARLLFSPPGIAMFVAVVSLVVGSFTGFHLARQASETKVQSDASELLRFDSRIWQDPMQFVNADKLLNAKLPTFTNALEQNWTKLCTGFLGSAASGQTNAVLFVINHHSPYPQGGELRLRARVAVLAALRAAGLAKKFADETRFVSLLTPEELAAANQEAPLDLKLVPWEIYTHDKSLPASSHPFGRVLVMWLPERAVKEHPWKKMAMLASRLVGTNATLTSTNFQVGVLGPRTSDGLAAWFSPSEIEFAKANPLPANVAVFFDHMKIVSPWARAPDAFFDFATNADSARPRAGAEKTLTNIFPNCSFTQFGATDDRLCFALAAELSLRGVDVTKDKILLLSEYDMLYGRSLPMTFRAVAASLQNFPVRNHNPLKLMEAIFSTVPADGSFTNSYTSLLGSFQRGGYGFKRTAGPEYCLLQLSGRTRRQQNHRRQRQAKGRLHQIGSVKR